MEETCFLVSEDTDLAVVVKWNWSDHSVTQTVKNRNEFAARVWLEKICSAISGTMHDKTWPLSNMCRKRVSKKKHCIEKCSQCCLNFHRIDRFLNECNNWKVYTCYVSWIKEA